MRQLEIFCENADNRAHLAESAASEPACHSGKHMETAWRAFAGEQDWLGGAVSPVRIPSAHTAAARARKTSTVRSCGLMKVVQ